MMKIIIVVVDLEHLSYAESLKRTKCVSIETILVTINVETAALVH